jgi:hypothetical protein
MDISLLVKGFDSFRRCLEDEIRMLHDTISGEGYSFWDITATWV